MAVAYPELFKKYGKWITATGKNPYCSWELKPGAPKEAKKMLEDYKKKVIEMRKQGALM